ncbi:ABC transporter permease [Fervidibacillus halotolerans]|uniref:ABC transporter permease n=1 Tax=Fervidibacillus halotolerans TaxID=2980027 RepID=A0A9E8M184_9BACI|nr:ABC transporter permease [Fervidibacillus halotolerans]WAA12656.1 ABC transporter permease [Fervidibacillus halotolerans]
MKYIRYCFIELKIILFRTPIAMFFSILFPLFMMAIIVGSTGNIEIGEGYHFIDKYVFIALGLGAIPTSLVSLPISIAVEKEIGAFERYVLFGINPIGIVLTKMVAHFFITFIQFIIVIFFGWIIFDLQLLPFHYFLLFLMHFSLCIIVLLLIGVLLANLFHRVQVVQIIGMFLMFLLLALTGGITDYSTLPETIKNVMAYVPITYLMNDFYKIWFLETSILPNFLSLAIIYIILLTLINLFVIYKNYKFLIINKQKEFPFHLVPKHEFEQRR